MPRRCTVCDHPKRKQIERALFFSSYRDIAGRYDLRRSSVHRHAQAHLRQSIEAAIAIEDQHRGADILAELRRMDAQLVEKMERAENDEKDGMWLDLHKERRAHMALLAKLRGLEEVAKDGKQTVNNTLVLIGHAQTLGAVADQVGLSQLANDLRGDRDRVSTTGTVLISEAIVSETGGNGELPMGGNGRRLDNED